MNKSQLFWTLEAQRFSAFFESPLVDYRNNWWVGLTGDENRRFTVDPRERTQVDRGADDNAGLALAVSAFRADLVQQYLLPEPGVVLPEADKAAGPFVDLAEKLLGLMPKINRMAVAYAVRTEAPSLVDANRLAQRLAPSISFDTASVTDFSLQMNKPVMSTRAEIQINRLTRWSVALEIISHIEASNPPTAVPVEPGRYYCRIDIDANTTKDSSIAVLNEQKTQLVRELSSVASAVWHEEW